MDPEAGLRIYPLPQREISGGVYADYGKTLEDTELPDARPYTVINMISTIDGKSTAGGKAGGLGGKADRDAMRNLRSWSDAVMIGAGTLRAERLSLGVPEHLAAQREQRGSAPQPLAVILSTSGDVSLDNLIHVPRQDVVVVTPCETANRVPNNLRSIRAPSRDDGNLDLRFVLGFLRSNFHADFLLVEGGPTLNRSLIDHQLADEFMLTISPKIVGGAKESFFTPVEGELERSGHSVLELTSVHLSDAHLFLRYSK